MLPFVALKALSFIPGGGLLKNPKVLIGIILIAALAFAYFKWKKSIEEAAYAAIYTQQAEQHIENQRREMERTQQLMTESQRAVREAQQRREQLLREIESARAQTRNVDPARNGEVAPVLSDTLDFLRTRSGAPVLPSKASEPTLGDKAKTLLDDAVKGTEEAVETGNSAIDEWLKRRKK